MSGVQLAVKRFGGLVSKFDEAEHPRDRRGRFIEIGATVEILGGATGTVVGQAKNGRIQVRLDTDGSTVERHRNYLTVTGTPKDKAPAKLPDANAPTATLEPEPVEAPAPEARPAPPAPEPEPAPPPPLPPPADPTAPTRPIGDAVGLRAAADSDAAESFARYGELLLAGLPTRKADLTHADKPSHRGGGQLDPDPSPAHLVSQRDAVAAKHATVTLLAEYLADTPDEILLGYTPGLSRGDLWQRDSVTGRMEPFVNDYSFARVSDAIDAGRVLRGNDPQVREALRYDKINETVANWAQTSNDSNARALAIQEVARREFGIADNVDWKVSPDLTRHINREIERHGAFYAAFLHAQYQATQDWFARHGITEVPLYRGMRWGEVGEEVPAWARGGAETQTTRTSGAVPLRPLSSFSLDPRTAAQFAGLGHGRREDPQTMVAATVPVSRILSLPRTGAGCLNEWEAVVLGGTGDMDIETINMPVSNEALARMSPADMDADLLRRAIRLNPDDPDRRAALIAAAENLGRAEDVPWSWNHPSTETPTFLDPYDPATEPISDADQQAAAATDVQDLVTARQLLAALTAQMNNPTTAFRQRKLVERAQRGDLEVAGLDISLIADHWGVPT